MGGSLLDGSESIDGSARVQDGLGECGLAATGVTHQGHVAYVGCLIRWHMLSLLVTIQRSRSIRQSSEANNQNLGCVIGRVRDNAVDRQGRMSRDRPGAPLFVCSDAVRPAIGSQGVGDEIL